MLSYDGFTNGNKSYFYKSTQIMYCQDQFYYKYIITGTFSKLELLYSQKKYKIDIYEFSWGS